MRDIAEQIYDELNAQVVRLLQHSLNQASRIADLERQLAEASAPAVEQKIKLDDIELYRCQMAGISTAAIGYWKEGDSIHPDYDTIALRDVAKLYAKYDALYKASEAFAPQAADTDKVREAILGLTLDVEPTIFAGWTRAEQDAYCKGFHHAQQAASELLPVMEAQAPVREVPEWISVKDRLPEVRDDSVLVLFDHGGIDMVHLQEYFGDITNGYSSDGEQLYTQYYKSAGITHWMPLPAAPVQQEGA